MKCAQVSCLLISRAWSRTNKQKLHVEEMGSGEGSAHAVYVPAVFHLPLMKLFVFMTSCHPGELRETWRGFLFIYLFCCWHVFPPPVVNDQLIVFVGVSARPRSARAYARRVPSRW